MFVTCTPARVSAERTLHLSLSTVVVSGKATHERHPGEAPLLDLFSNCEGARQAMRHSDRQCPARFVPVRWPGRAPGNFGREMGVPVV